MDPISLLTSFSSSGLKPAAEAAGDAGKASAEAAGSGAGSGGGFGQMLADKLGAVSESLQAVDTATQQVVTGQSNDISSVVALVEKANLELQLASQIRNKAVESYQDLFRMQI